MLEISGYIDIEQINARTNFLYYRGIRASDQKKIFFKATLQEQPPLDSIEKLKHEFMIIHSLNIEGISQAYELIKTLPDDQHYFVLQYGLKEIAVVRINLKGLEKEIAVISGRENSVRLLDEIRAEQGDDPNKWLPVFYQKIQQREQVKK